MPDNQFQVSPESVSADVAGWSDTAEILTRAAGMAGGLELDAHQLSFASHDGLADAYVAVVQRYRELTKAGADEAIGISEALNGVLTDYRTTDESGSSALRAAGQGVS